MLQAITFVSHKPVCYLVYTVRVYIRWPAQALHSTQVNINHKECKSSENKTRGVPMTSE
jgi:hypothetical protein